MTKPPRLELRVPSDSAELARVRRSLHEWLRRIGATEDESFEIVAACNEAFANAVEHPQNMRDPHVEVEACLSGAGEIRIAIRDTGAWRAEATPSDRGRGIRMMRALMDAVDVLPSPSGTELVLRRRRDGTPRFSQGRAAPQRSPAFRRNGLTHQFSRA